MKSDDPVVDVVHTIMRQVRLEQSAQSGNGRAAADIQAGTYPGSTREVALLGKTTFRDWRFGW